MKMLVRYSGILIPTAIVEEDCDSKRYRELKRLRVKNLKIIRGNENETRR